MMYKVRTVHQASGSNFYLAVIVLPPERKDNLNVRTDKQRTRNCRNISSMLKQTTGLVTVFSWTFCVRLKCHCTSIHNSCSHSLALLSWEILSHRTTTPGNKRQKLLTGLTTGIDTVNASPNTDTTLAVCHTYHNSLAHRGETFPAIYHIRNAPTELSRLHITQSQPLVTPQGHATRVLLFYLFIFYIP